MVHNELVKTTAFYVKTAIIFFLLGTESYVLARIIISFIKAGEYLKPPPDMFIDLGLVMIAFAYSLVLSVGAWDKWVQYVLIPMPISFGLVVALWAPNPTYTFVIGGIALALSLEGTAYASRIKNNLINFKPRFVFTRMLKRHLQIFSLAAAILVMAAPYYTQNSINIVGNLKSLIVTETGKVIDSQLNQGTNIGNFLQSGGLPFSPELVSDVALDVIEEGTIDTNTVVTETIKDTLSTELDRLIDPYQQVVPPLIALLIYGLFQLLATLVMFIYLATVDIIFWIGKKADLITIASKTVLQEVPTFMSPEMAVPEPSADNQTNSETNLESSIV